jgi:hypothetical protein
MGPRVSRGMETLITEVASVNFANERESAVEVGIPGY